ncbi:Uncharacterised protein [Escherichia coli]|nr:Uncharacterised protein [Escherichia coli]
MMQMKLQMQADHADNFAIQQRQMVAHVWGAQVGVKAHAKRMVVKLPPVLAHKSARKPRRYRTAWPGEAHKQAWCFSF